MLVESGRPVPSSSLRHVTPRSPCRFATAQAMSVPTTETESPGSTTKTVGSTAGTGGSCATCAGCGYSRSSPGAPESVRWKTSATVGPSSKYSVPGITRLVRPHRLQLSRGWPDVGRDEQPSRVPATVKAWPGCRS